MQTQLTVEEALNFSKNQAYWDGFVAGARSAADHAKSLNTQAIIKSKEVQNGPIAEPQYESAGCQPVAAEQPVPQVQPAGSGDEPERAEFTAVFPTDLADAGTIAAFGAEPIS